MSQFNTYARKVNEIAKNAFEEYRKAEADLKRAEEKRKDYPQRNGYGAEYEAKRAQAEADYRKSKAALEAASRELEKHGNEIKALRKDLAREVGDHYAVDPAAVDVNVMTLLNSGILKASDYAKLLKDAQNAGNNTMARLIAKSAGDAAEAEAAKNGNESENTRTLRYLSITASQNNGSDTLQAFDTLSGIYDRTARNPLIIDHWDELTGAIIENF